MKVSAVVEAECSPLLELLGDELEHLERDVPAHLWERALLGPAREFLRRPGKQFRASLVASAWELAGGAAGELPPQLPLIVEIIHAGSLIVDDIEDGSDERRGAPALHQLYGTAVALNTGNWMYFWPLALIARMPLPETTRAQLTRRANTTMLHCHHGQALDLGVRVADLTQPEVAGVVRATTRLKTGTLMELAAALGATAAGAAPEIVRRVASFGQRLGIGLQMLDDLGGLTSAKRRAKGYEDLRLGRVTWPWAWLAETASATAFAKLQAMSRAAGEGADPELLGASLKSAVAEHGRRRVHEHLAAALAVVGEAARDSDAISALRAELHRLEKSYG